MGALELEWYCIFQCIFIIISGLKLFHLRVLGFRFKISCKIVGLADFYLKILCLPLLNCGARPPPYE